MKKRCFDFNNFCMYTNRVLPLVYDNSLSLYELCAKLLCYLKELAEDINQLEELGGDIEQLQKDVAFLQDEFEKVKNGDYVSLYLDSIIAWIDKNIQELVARIVKYVCFGLTMDGHFCAYIPETWDFIQFDTIMNGESPLYGHLTLRW